MVLINNMDIEKNNNYPSKKTLDSKEVHCRNLSFIV